LSEKIVSLFFSLIPAVFSIVILMNYFQIFFKKKSNRVLTVSVIGLYLLGKSINVQMPFQPPYANLIINVFLTICISVAIYVGSALQKVVFSFLVNLIWMFMEFFVGYTFVLCKINYSVPRFLGTIVSQCLTLFLILVLKKYFCHSSMKNLPNKYNIILLLIIIGSMFIVYNTFMLCVEFGIYEYIDESLMSLLIILFLNILVFKLHLELSIEKELEKFNVLYEQQIELYDQYMKEKEEDVAEYRRMRHDLKQHFTVLIGILQKNDTISAEEYLYKNINNDKAVRNIICRSDNIVVDTMINMKYSLALNYKIEMQCDVHIPRKLPFKSADICVVLGNILDNAIEATKKNNVSKKYINLYVRYETNVLIITCINPYAGRVKISQNGKILTSKDDYLYHGMGIESIYKIANKYHGSVIIDHSDAKFIIKITMLQLE